MTTVVVQVVAFAGAVFASVRLWQLRDKVSEARVEWENRGRAMGVRFVAATGVAIVLVVITNHVTGNNPDQQRLLGVVILVLCVVQLQRKL